MASSSSSSSSINFFPYCLISCLLLLSLSTTSLLAQPSFRPSALVVPVTKDAATLQYVTEIRQRTPLVPVSLVVDLGGRYSWIDCDDPAYVSSTYRPARCGSAACSLAQADGCGTCNGPARPGCNNNTCSLTPDNTVTHTATSGELASDVVSVNSTDGSNPGRAVSANVLFVCGATFLLEGLAAGVKGMAAFGRTKVSLPPQFSAAFSFDRKFAICLSSSSSSKGVIFFGDGPYNFLLNVKAADSLVYTPLLINPVSTSSAYPSGEKSAEYFIGVKSITVGDKTLTLNSTLLSIDSSGNGGTKISTVNPYTVLETSIYAALTKTFVSQMAARNISRVSAVAPFEFCFNSDNVGSTRVGPAVPYISLGLQNKNTVWTITGSNSMVYVNDNVLCLGFVNGGDSPRTSVVIGGKQLEDNLLQFDLAASKVGFSSTLLGRSTTCANFNFTINA